MNELKERNPIDKIYVDEKTRFPMIVFHELPFAVSWLPMTRVQLEFFLSDVNDIRFDANWYIDIILKNNPRVSPNHVKQDNLSGVFATNLLLKEARRVASWYGHFGGMPYDLPTKEQWEALYAVCEKSRPLSSDHIPKDIDPRAKSLLRRLNKQVSIQTLADQMLLNSTLSEYIYREESRQSCQITGRKKGEFTLLRGSLDREGDRRSNLTFRLICQLS